MLIFQDMKTGNPAAGLRRRHSGLSTGLNAGLSSFFKAQK